MIGFSEIFCSPRPLIGMVHLPPLPGSPRYGGDLGRTIESALRDARILEEEGFDALLVENFGDAPFLPGPVEPETVAAMALATARVVSETRVPVGVNVLRNDARAALGVAVASGARFIRVNVHTGVTATDQGIVEGRAWETLRERDRLRAEVLIFADVLVKHGTPLLAAPPAQIAKDLVERGRADVLLVTGEATGEAVDAFLLETIKGAVPGTPVLVASGLDAAGVPRLMPLVDGAIVGSSLKRGGKPAGPVDRARCRRLMKAVREIRP